jgi:hypothetical protein
MEDLIEFGAIFVAILLVFTLFERSIAAQQQAQANLATQNMWTGLAGQTGQDLLHLVF